MLYTYIICLIRFAFDFLAIALVMASKMLSPCENGFFTGGYERLTQAPGITFSLLLVLQDGWYQSAGRPALACLKR